MKGVKPAKLQVIQGGIVDAVPPPKGMPESQVDDWNTVTANLAQRGLLDDASLLNVPAYCSVLDTIRDCNEIIATDGRFIKNKDGIPRAHPALAQLQKATELANRMAAEFGLTPSSRSRRGMAGGGAGGQGAIGVEDFL